MINFLFVAVLVLEYVSLNLSVLFQVSESITVSLKASDLNIPGVYLMHDFVTAEEEKVKISLYFSGFLGLLPCFHNCSALPPIFT